ncbi:MAG: TetR/AcrR family transcriptional regulator [Candidatus Coproplasma sp.]
MDKGNTKRDILNAALNLFSTQGYEATSISQIANAVGVRKASLYSHFKSKQAVLDELKNQVLEEYEKKSVFAKSKQNTDGAYPKTCNEVVLVVKSQINYILHDPFISKARKMLTIEQFRNPELAKLQTKQNYSDVMRYFTDLMTNLQEQGVLRDGDSQIMAAQFCLPITVWINLCDREPNTENEKMELIERHVRQFFATYGRDSKGEN